MKFFITGANGFIGSNLTKKLVESGHAVSALIFKGTDESPLDELKEKIEIVYGDVTDMDSIRPFLKGVDVVVHLAARVSDWGSEKEFMHLNYEGTKNVLDAAIEAQVKRFIFMSSLTVHGFEGFLNADESTAYKPWNAYARSKKAVEDLLNAYYSQGKIETCVVRPGFTIFGPNDKLFSYEVYSRIDDGKSFPVVNHARTVTCYSYVENLADGLILVATHPKAAGQTYIISDGPVIPFKDFMAKMFAAGGKELKLMSIPSWLAYPAAGLLEAIYKLVRSKKGPLITLYRVKVIATDLGFTNGKIVKELGYKAPIGIDEAFKRTYESYKQSIKAS
jgi:dihydroflavonol-4-reductase